MRSCLATRHFIGPALELRIPEQETCATPRWVGSVDLSVSFEGLAYRIPNCFGRRESPAGPRGIANSRTGSALPRALPAYSRQKALPPRKLTRLVPIDPGRAGS